MSRIRIVPIVEGHGEDIAARKLLERIWLEVINGEFADVLRPVRQPRSKLLRRNRNDALVPERDEIIRAVKLAAMKLNQKDDPNTPALVLLMLDADRDCPKEIFDAIQPIMSDIDPSIDVSMVFPYVEYETWFVACACSLAQFLELQPGNDQITDPESRKLGKSWIRARFRRYSETVDQVGMTAKMDLTLCRQYSPSFDKLCRELEARAARR